MESARIPVENPNFVLEERLQTREARWSSGRIAAFNTLIGVIGLHALYKIVKNPALSDANHVSNNAVRK